MSRALLALVLPVSLMGCIVTREPGYSDPPNTPAVVLGTAETPFNQFIDVYLDDPTNTDGGVQTQITISARIRDPDVRQPLQGLVWVDFNPDLGADNLPVSSTIDIPPNGTAYRDVRFEVLLRDLLPSTPGATSACRSVELHVSERFGGFPPEPAAEGDVGVGVWWVNVAAERGDEVTLDECQ